MSPSTADRYPAGRAMDEIAATRRLSTWLDEHVAGMTDTEAAGASLLPGWSRAHVLTHLARNADGLVNLLTWARTGVEHAMYTSDADRDADIAGGARRMAALLKEDVAASNQRFFAAAESLSSSAWEAEVAMRGGTALPAHRIPALRLSEVAIHAVDLDYGAGFSEVLALVAGKEEVLLERVVAGYGGRQDVPAVRLEVTMPAGGTRTWTFGSVESSGGGRVVDVAGEAGAALGWLSGRCDGSSLHGRVPALPAWR